MREVKFRAWIGDKKRWADNVMVFGDGSWSATIGNVEGYSEGDGGVLVQYTGLKDKNGNEIYESDILGLDEGPEQGKQTAFGRVTVCFGEYDDSDIEYGSQGFGWYLVGYHGYYRKYGPIDRYDINEESLVSRNIFYEIIGNIYENEDLIKG